MKTVVTVTEMASMPGRFECTHQTLPDGRLYHTTHAGQSPEAAAAFAVMIALKTGGPYFIFGPKKMLDLIPVEIQTRVT